MGCLVQERVKNHAKNQFSGFVQKEPNRISRGGVGGKKI